MVTTSVPLFVNGGGMRGGPIHHTIAEQRFLGEWWTAPKYRFYSVGDRFPALRLVGEGGVAVPGVRRTPTVNATRRATNRGHRMAPRSP